MQWYLPRVAWEIAGRWVGSGGGRLLVLRVDVGPGSLEMLSGDLYEGEGSTDDDPDDGRGGWRYLCSFHSELVQRRWLHARALELRAALTFQSRAELYGELVLRFYVPMVGRPETPAEAELLYASHRRPGGAARVRVPLAHRSRALRRARL
jgi:hypothetical protein